MYNSTIGNAGSCTGISGRGMLDPSNGNAGSRTDVTQQIGRVSTHGIAGTGTGISAMRIRGGAPTGDEDEGEPDVSVVLDALSNDPRGSEILRTLYQAYNHPAALSLALQNISQGLAASRQEMEALQANRLRPFHSSLEGVIDDKLVITRELALQVLPRTGELPVHMDADSLYWISTCPNELIQKLALPGKAIFNFQSLTRRTEANTSSRFAIAGNVIRQKVKGKTLPKVNLEKFPNVKLAYIDSGKPGVGTYLHMYFCGLDYIQKKPYFTDTMLGLVNVALNVARKAVPTGDDDEIYTCFSEMFSTEDSIPADVEKGKLAYNSLVQLLPIFESPKSEGAKGASVQRKNRKTSMKGVFGGLFLELFFEVIEKIANESEGFTCQDDIWDHHYHGMGREAEILPSAMVVFAKSLNNNMIVSAQSVGLKNHFQNQQTFTANIASGRTHVDANLSTVQDNLDSLVASLSEIFDLPDDRYESLSPDMTTRFFADFALNIFPRNETYYLVPFEENVDQWFQDVLDSTHHLDPVDDSDSDDGSLAGELSQEDIDEMLNGGEDAQEDEEDLQTILRDYEPNQSNSFAMLASQKKVSNVATGKMLLVVSRSQHGKFGKIHNPRMGMCISGGQVYCPYLRHYFRADVRQTDVLLNRFPTYVLDLVTNSDTMGEPRHVVRDRCMGILEMIEDCLHHALEQVHTHPRSHVRIEYYFDLTSSRKPEWPKVNFIAPLRTLKHAHFTKYLKELIGRSLPPLRLFLQAESERSRDERTDVTLLPASAKTRLFQCAETAVLLCNAPRYESKVFKDLTLSTTVMEVPIERRVDLPHQIRGLTGLGYGIDPALLSFKNNGYPPSAHTTTQEVTSPLSRIFASRLSKEVVIALSFIDSCALAKRCFLEFQARAEGRVRSEENPLEFALLEDINYQVLRTSLNDSDRKHMLVELSHILINLYEKEWHYYLFVPKKRKSNAREICWPSDANKLEHLPTTVAGVRNFQELEPNSVHIEVSRSSLAITTEGTLSNIDYSVLKRR
jgi:hypothetical protein